MESIFITFYKEQKTIMRAYDKVTRKNVNFSSAVGNKKKLIKSSVTVVTALIFFIYLGDLGVVFKAFLQFFLIKYLVIVFNYRESFIIQL